MSRQLRFSARHEEFDLLRTYPEFVAMSLEQARHLLALPDDIKRHLFSHYAGYLRWLLPEHRALVMNSIGEVPDASKVVTIRSAAKVADPKIDGVACPPLTDDQTAGVLIEVLDVIHRDGRNLRQQLVEAVSAQDRERIVRLLNANIYSSWYTAHVLAPFVEQHAGAMEAMGIDPSYVLAQAESHSARQLAFSQPTDAPSAVNAEGKIASMPPPSHQAPAPTMSSSPPTSQPAARVFTTTIRVGGASMSAEQLIQIMTATGRAASATASPQALARSYSSLLPIMDAIEQAIRTDETDAAFGFPLGRIENALSHRAPDHPLAEALALAGRNRLSIASRLAEKGLHDTALSDVQKIRVSEDACFAADLPNPTNPTFAPLPPSAITLAEPPAQTVSPQADMPAPPVYPTTSHAAPQLPISPPPPSTGPTAAPLPTSASALSEKAPPAAAYVASVAPDPREGQSAGAARRVRVGHFGGWFSGRKHASKAKAPARSKRAPRRRPERLPSTQLPATPGRSFLRAVGVLGIIAGFVIAGLWGIRYGIPLVQALAASSASGVRYVKTADTRFVPAFTTPEAARIGSGITPQTTTLRPGNRYRVIGSEGDVLQIEGRSPTGAATAMWVDARFVVDAQ